MPYKRKEIEQTLKSKLNFTRDKNHSSDHRWYSLEFDFLSIPTVKTKLSHTRKEISKNTLGKIARQLRVTTPFLKDTIKCSKEFDDYENYLRKNRPPPHWKR